MCLEIASLSDVDKLHYLFVVFNEKHGSPKHVVMLRMLSLPRDSIRLDIITTGTGLPKAR